MQNEQKVFSYSENINFLHLLSSFFFRDGTQPWKNFQCSARITEQKKKSLKEAFYDEELKVFNDSFSYFLFLSFLPTSLPSS